MTFLVLAIPLAPRRKKRMWCLSYRDRVDDTLYCTGDLGDAQDEQEFVTFVRGELIRIHVLQNVSAGVRVIFPDIQASLSGCPVYPGA